MFSHGVSTRGTHWELGGQLDTLWAFNVHVFLGSSASYMYLEIDTARQERNSPRLLPYSCSCQRCHTSRAFLSTTRHASRQSVCPPFREYTSSIFNVRFANGVM